MYSFIRMAYSILSVGTGFDEKRAVPTGLMQLLAILPGTTVPGFHMPPLRGWVV